MKTGRATGPRSLPRSDEDDPCSVQQVGALAVLDRHSTDTPEGVTAVVTRLTGVAVWERRAPGRGRMSVVVSRCGTNQMFNPARA